MNQKIRLLKCNFLRTIKLKQRIDCEPCQTTEVTAAGNLPRPSLNSVQVKLRKIDKAKYKIILTNFLNSLKCLLGRLPILVYFIVQNLHDLNVVECRKDRLELGYALTSTCVYVSYTVSFFFYFHGNSLFRNNVIMKLKSWKKLI